MRLLKILVALVMTVTFTTNVWASYPWAPTYTVSAAGTILADHYNAGMNDVITHSTPADINDYSTNVTQMQATTDPYPASSESLATTLAGELQGLRYQLDLLAKKFNTGATEWYHDITDEGVLWTTGSDVTSGTSTTFATDGRRLDVTGTTAITSFSAVGVGTIKTVEFTGALVLTHHTTDLRLPNGANITTIAGDIGTFHEYASGDWELVAWQGHELAHTHANVANGGALTSPVINTSVSGTAFLDEDDMASDSATKFSSQQSIKAYIASHLPRSYLAGLGTSIGTDTEHDIDIAVGKCTDSSNSESITLASIITKQNDAPWAVGDDAGGSDQAQLDGAQTVTFADNGGSDDDVTIDSGTWAVTPSVGDTLVVVGGTNAGSYQITAATTTQIDVATASFTTDASSASAIYTVKIDTTYHVFVIKRTDTGVVDALFSESPTSPTMPTNYDKKRRIGAVLTNGSANIITFVQDGDEFLWDIPVNDYTSASTGGSGVTRALTVPMGIVVKAIHTFELRDDTPSASVFAIVTPLSITGIAPDGGIKHVVTTAGAERSQVTLYITTNTSAQIRTRVSASAVDIFNIGTTHGWIDCRGRGD